MPDAAQPFELDRRATTVVVWCLRAALALQAMGVGMRRLGFFNAWEDDSPVFGLLLYEWQWQEATAQRVDDCLAWLYLLCGVAVFVLPLGGAGLRMVLGRNEPLVPVWLWQVPLCVIVGVVQLIVTLVAWHRGGFFMSEWTPVGDAARLAPAVVLILLAFGRSSAGVAPRQLAAGIWILRIAICMTFVGHGLKAIYGSPVFVDFLLAAADRVGWEPTEASAQVMLRMIGVMDLMVAALVVFRRWRAVAYYMAAWAFIGALARVMHTGSGASYEVLIRAGNYCVPLAIALYWQMLQHVSRRDDDC